MKKEEFEMLEQQAIHQAEEIKRLQKEVIEANQKRYLAEANEYKYKVAFKELVKELKGSGEEF